MHAVKTEMNNIGYQFLQSERRSSCSFKPNAERFPRGNAYDSFGETFFENGIKNWLSSIAKSLLN
jgi:hypothetical protein